MTGSPGLLTTIFAFLLVLGPLVLIHELGHYLVGRLFGVKADAFSIGFGKELAGWTDRRGTRWKLSALPLGGYVQFAGDMNPASAAAAADPRLTPAERAQTFHSKPLWQRALIVLAGPMTNLLLCVAIFAAFYGTQGRLVDDAEISGFEAGSAAQKAGMRIGDRIVAIDGDDVDGAFDVAGRAAYFPGKTLSVAVEREGRTVVVPVTLAERVLTDQFGNTARIGDLGVRMMPPVVGGFYGDSPAEAAGLKLGDRIVSVNGVAVSGFEEIPELIRPNAGRSVDLTVRRDGALLTLPVKVAEATLTDATGKPRKVGQIGVRAGRLEQVGPLRAVGLGFSQSFRVMGDMVTGIMQIFTGDRSVRELGGPVKIAQYSGQQFTLGWEAFVSFAALISINLAFINLLPIPGLDGGHLAFYAAEMVRRRPLGARSQEWAIRTGVALVLALMVFVTVNDLASLPIFGG
ncbi:RIP metalloprotease RseP [Novosphingobium panipatense]|uniref:Zinc metalloprotease n=1 Tax=Novosphingobium panipatense TaxID=428991 RepID=A0ABY1QSW0_9SPHN|nr:RIP metalloprotease RseP [Novosphingobium panipatense]SMP77975.1 regulator of sigma E protease [Novosphingobium panipatense]